jgi:hypothetical protein
MQIRIVGHFQELKKPYVAEEGILGAYKIAMILVFGDFEGEFIKKFLELNHSP